MPTKTVEFNKAGGPVTVEVRCGQAQDGAYIITLWNRNSIAERHEGNFLNTDDDAYELGGTAEGHDGHTVQCKAEINIEPGNPRYALTLQVRQDGAVLDVVEESGTAAEGTLKAVNLFAELKGV